MRLVYTSVSIFVKEMYQRRQNKINIFGAVFHKWMSHQAIRARTVSMKVTECKKNFIIQESTKHLQEFLAEHLSPITDEEALLKRSDTPPCLLSIANTIEVQSIRLKLYRVQLT